VEDGVVARPEACQTNLAELQCDPGQAEGCFSAVEIDAIRRLYQGATVQGEQLFSGVPPGSESLWPIWLVGTDEQWAWGELASMGNLRMTYGIPSGEPFNAHDYVLADELDNLRRYSDVLDAVDPDLTGLEKAGGKLFYYHGLADPLILEGRVRQYYDESVAVMGEQRLNGVASFVMVPGFGHCWEKPGQVADGFDPLQVIDQWVESGEAPETITAVRKSGDADMSQSRKLCRYPEVAMFTGDDPGSAESFTCKPPD
jgi:feruloyl esterase